MRLVLLALLGRAPRRVEVGARREALHALALEIAVGHRVAEHGDAAGRARGAGRPSQRAICDLPQPVRTAETAITGTRRGSIVRSGPSRTKSAPARERARAGVHDRGVRDVAVGEDDLVDALAPAERLELALVLDGDAVRVSGPASDAG